MTFWEFRVKILFLIMKVLKIRLKDIYVSYPFNPFNEYEVEEFFKECELNYNGKKKYF